MAARQASASEDILQRWELVAWGDPEAGGVLAEGVNSTVRTGVQSEETLSDAAAAAFWLLPCLVAKTGSTDSAPPSWLRVCARKGLHATTSAFLAVSSSGAVASWGSQAAGGQPLDPSLLQDSEPHALALSRLSRTRDLFPESKDTPAGRRCATTSSGPVAKVFELGHSFVIVFKSGEALTTGRAGMTAISGVPGTSVDGQDLGNASNALREANFSVRDRLRSPRVDTVFSGFVTALQEGTYIVRGWSGNSDFFVGGIGLPCVPGEWEDWGACKSS